MTLSAFDSSFNLINPSASIEALRSAGADSSGVLPFARRASQAGLFCPHCYERTGLRLPVVFCGSSDRRVHFRHLKGEAENQSCASKSAESEKHKAFKVYIQTLLLIQGLADVKVETRVEALEPGLTFRKPDVLVTYPNGQMEAHEIQVSRIDSRELERRTNGLKKYGCATVVWYFYGNNYNDENRLWCHNNGIRRFRIWIAETFEDGSLKPSIKEDIDRPEPKKTKSADEDSCSKRRRPLGGDRYKNTADDSLVVPPPNKPYPIRTKRKAEATAIVGKKGQNGWVGYVHSMSGDLAYVQWMYESSNTPIAAQDLVVLDYGEETAAVLKAIGVKVLV